MVRTFYFEGIGREGRGTRAVQTVGSRQVGHSLRRSHRRRRGSGLASLWILSAAAACFSVAVPSTANGDWFLDFQSPPPPTFLAVGIDESRHAISDTFVAERVDGVLQMYDTRAPSDGGAQSAFAVDVGQEFTDVRVTGTIIPTEFNDVVIDPEPGTSSTTTTGGANSLGLLARGDVFRDTTYAGGINFIDGTLFMARVNGGYVPDYITSYDVGDGSASGSTSLRQIYPDYRQRSFFLQFDVRGNRPTYLTLRAFDSPGGEELMQLNWQRDFGPTSGASGVFVQAFDFSQNVSSFPRLQGSFDDVTVIVPEPSSLALLVIGSVLGPLAVRRRKR